MRVYILRHGQTDLNRERRVQGHLNVELNETGIRQAKELAEVIREKGLHFDRVYSSPLKRALDTCQIVTGRSLEEIRIDERLKEFNFAELEGSKYTELPGTAQTFFTAPERFKPMGEGETFPELIDRVMDFLEDLKKVDAETVLLTSHGTAIHAMLLALEHKELKDFWNEDVHNCDLIPLDLVDGTFVVSKERVSVAHPADHLPSDEKTGCL